MPHLPAICTQCAAIFPSGISVGNTSGSYTITIAPCPRCGGDRVVPNNFYAVRDEIIAVLAQSACSVEHVERIYAAVENVKHNARTEEELRERLNAEVKEFTSVFAMLPREASQLHAFLTVFLDFLSRLIEALPAKQPSITEEEMETLFEHAVEAQMAASAKQEPYRALPKVGRNKTCPCGSGKKYKKCCGL